MAVKPISREYIPQTLGKNQMHNSITIPLTIKEISVLLSKPIELSMLVVMLDKLIKSIKNADAVRYSPH